MSRSIAAREPKYAQLKQILLDRIKAGELKAGDKISSENELVTEYGVSKHTVLKALTALVNEGVLYREQGRGTFVARREPSVKTVAAGTIGVIMPFLTDEPLVSPASRILNAVSHGIEKYDKYRIILRNSAGNSVSEAAQIEECLDAGVAGMIVYPGYETSGQTADALRRARSAGVPFVLVDHNLPELEASFVGTSDVAGAFELVTHLVRQGYRRIAHITLPRKWFDKSSAAKERAEGYCKGLEAHGIKFNSDLVKYRTKDDCTEVLGSLMDLKEKPTAIFATDAFTCIQIYRALREKGIRIPQEIALAGFDDIPTASLLDTPLTMMRQSFEKIGEKALGHLVNMIEGGNHKAVSLRVAPRLVIRASTGGK
ncbi:MAG: GntR family transcriptional regulator [Planctomycetes bacterium]|nr:GntR family transcriptional regulator [Planctomycetota bacterium]